MTLWFTTCACPNICYRRSALLLQRRALRRCQEKVTSQSYLLKTVTPGQSHGTSYAAQRPPPPPPPPPPDALRSTLGGGAGGATAHPTDKTATQEIAELKKKLVRKEELLRVRNAQLVEVYAQAHDRERLWGLADERAHLHALLLTK